ncbi:hypothetical protein ACROYT_G006612 [Oculina patagonica]
MSGLGRVSAFIICLVVFLTGHTSAFSWGPIVSPSLYVNDRIIARWTNNLYYAGKVSSIGKGLIHVLFDDGDRISHSIADISAVIPDKVSYHIDVGSHVVTTWKGGHKYYIGYVTEKDASNRLKVTFDDNDEDYYKARQLRIFPEHFSAHEVGARVFANGTDGLYRRGFVTSATSTTVLINYDGGDTITLYKNDGAAVILDKLPCYSDVRAGERVIGFWPGRTGFSPGDVVYKRNLCSISCYRKAAYQVMFDDGEVRIQDFHQIRLIPCTTSSRG